jgi:hypothetical protein
LIDDTPWAFNPWVVDVPLFDRQMGTGMKPRLSPFVTSRVAPKAKGKT